MRTFFKAIVIGAGLYIGDSIAHSIDVGFNKGIENYLSCHPDIAEKLNYKPRKPKVRNRIGFTVEN